ncbi:MAG: sigma-E processing peptidase SpoIIGA [Ruminococcus sp.]|nr:sigma-E processing peptidase SpoIIGA [Ruminococcus sp.]
MKIYIDVLMITNAAVTLVYLGCIARITRQRIKRKNAAAASAVGALGALLLIPDSSSFFGAVILTAAKAAVISAVIWLGLRPKTAAGLAGRVAAYICCELMTGGICTAAAALTHRRIIMIKNYVVYFDTTLPQLGISCAAVYMSAVLYDTLKHRNTATLKKYRAEYRLGAYSEEVTALADSGNRLCDSFTGLPVVIFRSDELYTRLSLDRPEKLFFYGFHAVPYETMSGEGVVFVTSRGSIKIRGEGRIFRPVCCTGILPGGGKKGFAVFDPEILDERSITDEYETV